MICEMPASSNARPNVSKESKVCSDTLPSCLGADELNRTPGPILQSHAIGRQKIRKTKRETGWHFRYHPNVSGSPLDAGLCSNTLSIEPFSEFSDYTAASSFS